MSGRPDASGGDLIRLPGAPEPPSPAAPPRPAPLDALRDAAANPFLVSGWALIVVLVLVAAGPAAAVAVLALLAVGVVVAAQVRARPPARVERGEDPAVLDDPRVQTLLHRPHRPDPEPEGDFPRFAVEVALEGERPAVRLLRFDPAGPGSFRVKVDDGRTFMPGSDSAQVRELALGFADRAREREFQARAAWEARSTRPAREEQLAREIGEISRQVGSGEEGPHAALARRRHKEEFPGVQHKAYCVQLGTDGRGNPNVRLLRWNPAFPGRPERTEYAVERDMSFEPDETVRYTEVATKWALDARELEARAYAPIREKLEAAEAAQRRAEVERELERQRREEAQATIEAARRALEH